MAACERCPFAGACASCPFRRPLTGEFGKRTQIVSTLKEISPEFKGTITFNPEPTIRTSEQTCFICKEAASTCSHSKPKTSALAAA